MKKLVCLLLALLMVISLFPVMASAKTIHNKPNYGKPNYGKPDFSKPDHFKPDMPDFDFGHHPHPKPEPKPEPEPEPKPEDKKEEKKEEQAAAVYYHDANKHSYDGYGSNTAYHWLQCACGCKISVEPHIDPKEAKDDYCICGYKFSDNADLVVLWIDGCPGIEKFNKNTTEYKLNAHTYKDVKEIRIVTKTHDSEAKVELPEDLTLKTGENKFEIKVTAENQKVTKIYTVTVVK